MARSRRPFSKPVCAREERSGLPSVDQGLFTAKPRSSHVTWARVETHPPPPVLPFLLAQNLSPKTLPEVTSQAESSMTHVCVYYV